MEREEQAIIPGDNDRDPNNDGDIGPKNEAGLLWKQTIEQILKEAEQVPGASLAEAAWAFIDEARVAPFFSTWEEKVRERVEKPNILIALAMSLNPVKLTGERDVRSLGLFLPKDLEAEEPSFLWQTATETLALTQGIGCDPRIWTIINSLRLFYSDAELVFSEERESIEGIKLPTKDLFGPRKELEPAEIEKISQIFKRENLILLWQSGFLGSSENELVLQLSQLIEHVDSSNEFRIINNVLNLLKEKIDVARLIVDYQKTGEAVDQTAMVLALTAWEKQLVYYQRRLERALDEVLRTAAGNTHEEEQKRLWAINDLRRKLTALKSFLTSYQEFDGQETPLTGGISQLNQPVLQAVEQGKFVGRYSGLVPDLGEIYASAFPGGVTYVDYLNNEGEKVRGVQVPEWIKQGGIERVIISALQRFQRLTLAFRLVYGDIGLNPNENPFLLADLFSFLQMNQPASQEQIQKIAEQVKFNHFSELVQVFGMMLETSCFNKRTGLAELIMANCLRRLRKRGELSAEVLLALKEAEGLVELPFLLSQAELRGMVSRPETGQERLEKIKESQKPAVEKLLDRIRPVLSLPKEGDLVDLTKDLITFLYNLYVQPPKRDIREKELSSPMGGIIIGRSGSGKTMIALTAAAEIRDALKEAEEPPPAVSEAERGQTAPHSPEEPVAVWDGDPFQLPEDGGSAPETRVLAPVEARAVTGAGGGNQLRLSLEGTGALAEYGQVRELDIVVPVPGDWIGGQKVTLQFRLTLVPEGEAE